MVMPNEITKHQIDWTLIIEFLTDFNIASGAGFSGLIDRVALKNGEGILYIPGATIKGRARAMFEKIHRTLTAGTGGLLCGPRPCCPDSALPCVSCRIFGSPPQTAFFEGPLYFDDARLYPNQVREIARNTDAVLPGPGRYQTARRFNISVDRRRRVAEEERLFSSDNGVRGLCFQGRVHGTIEVSSDECQRLKEAIQFIEHFGGQKARGLGRCVVTVQGDCQACARKETAL
jgi:CRISPR/Cas system CSM-associated protein Csm3 (group 7 of RAMP superfamily)